MGTKVTKKLFEHVVSEEAGKLFAPLGFAETDSGAFTRDVGEVRQGFGFTVNPSFTHFHMPVGVAVPALAEIFDYISGAPYPALLVSRWLGEFKDKFTSHDYYFHFATVEQLRELFPKVYTDFAEQAESWLAGLTTVDAVAKEFLKWRIAPPSTGETRLPDPAAWAIYGWLLQMAGKESEAMPWFKRALDELRVPRYGKEGRLVPRGTTGARLIEWNAADKRLRELLEREGV